MEKVGPFSETRDSIIKVKNGFKNSASYIFLEILLFYN